MSLLTKIQTLLSTWFPNKQQDKINFNKWLDECVINENGVYKTCFWKPSLNGETGANYKYSYSESNGEGVGKGFVLKNGFFNTKKWKLSFEFKHDNIRYTGIIFLCNAITYTIPDSSHNADTLKTWEGGWSGGSAYATYKSGAVGWFDVTVTKIDDTHVRLQSTILNRDTTVEVSWLSNATKLTCGAVHNSSSSGYGPCRIRNVRVMYS